MIKEAIKLVSTELGDYLELRSPGNGERRLALLNLVNAEGKLQVHNKVAMMVVNIEENRVYRSLRTYERLPDGTGERVMPEVRVNLYVLFAASFDQQYEEALKAINLVVAFFQHRNAFDVVLEDGIGRRRAIFEIYPLTFEQQNHLWATLGAKYLPSVLYRASFVDIRDTQVRAVVKSVEEIRAEAH